MKLAMSAFLSVIVMATSCFAATVVAEEGTEKQPVFLLCPHHERYGSWSLYVTVNKSDPSKVLNLGLEELVEKNSKDDGGYEKVIDAQNNPATSRMDLGTLDAKSFGSGSLRVAKNNALNVTCTPVEKGLQLMIDMRITSDGHFVIGGPEVTHRNIVLMYNKETKKWHAFAIVLEDNLGQNKVGAEPLRVTGLAFKVTGTGIFRILAAVPGSHVMVYDK